MSLRYMLYVKKDENGEFVVVCIYVDDIVYFGLSKAVVAEFKSSME